VPAEGRTTGGIRLLLLGAVLVAAFVPAAGGADSGSSFRVKAAQLTHANGVLAVHSHSAVLSLYALDTRLTQARAQLATLEAQAAAVQRERAEVSRRVGIARSVVAASQRQLAARLRTLYEQGGNDALAVVVGADSLDEALTELDGADASAVADRQVIAQARESRKRLARLAHVLAQRDTQLRRLRAAARASAASLAGARAERVLYLSRLATQRRLNQRQIASLLSEAGAVEAHARAVAVEQAAAAAVSPAPTSQSGATLTVVATGYAIHGRTSTGAPTGYGVVAVDPSVIPLGTRMSIPGYGEGIAADTGAGVRGAMIDLWFPTPAQAAAWGRRTVTITLH
jgi:3D (Asp-Asp-Asp) domain-containing protein/L-fucose mutarotase/ribose pyranase (RbsD/FucU family)